jgi:hypothetical protein
MTLPDERYNAIRSAKLLCEDLLDSTKTPRVPKLVRQRARQVLRHFPEDYYLARLAEESPNILERKGVPLDPLYKLVKDYSVDQQGEQHD